MNVSAFERSTGMMTLLGLVLLYLGGTLYAPPDVSPGNVEREDTGTLVRVSGMVVDVREHKGTRFFAISDETGELRGVAFDGEIPANASGRYTITGRVKVYEGEREIVVRRAVPVDTTRTPG